MSVLRVYVPNSFQNYNHIVFCSATGVAAAVDPFDAKLLHQISEKYEFTIKQIWLTHEHGDHIRQLKELKALTGADVFAPKTCQNSFDADTWLEHNDELSVGELSVQHWLTPGHTPGHGVYACLSEHKRWAIFGDTIFNAGVGNVRSGNVEQLYQSIQMLKQRLPDNTEVFTGHDYLITNLEFTLSEDPNNEEAQKLLQNAQQLKPETRQITSWGQEKQINLFLKAHSFEAFRELRLKRDQW